MALPAAGLVLSALTQNVSEALFIWFSEFLKVRNRPFNNHEKKGPQGKELKVIFSDKPPDSEARAGWNQ